MKIIKLGGYDSACANEHLNPLLVDIEKLFGESILNKTATVCHYFPKSALLNIVKDQKLYFSDLEFLNDYSETQPLYSMVEEVIAETEVESPATNILKEILRIKPLIKDEISFTPYEGDDSDGFIYNRRNYALCCSLDNDCLSNWKYYGKGNGYDAFSIMFKANNYLEFIEQTLGLSGYKCLSGLVVYDNEVKRRLIHNLIHRINSFVTASNLTENTFRDLTTWLFYYIMDMSLFFKDSYYQDEKEYRFVLSLDNSKIKSNNLEYDFRFVNDILVPFLKIPFDKDMIEIVCIGPCLNTDISIKSLSALLKYYNFNNASIGISDIPLRY